MELSPTQLQTLADDIVAETDPEFVGYRDSGQTGAMANWYNEDSAFIVYKPSESTFEIGEVVSYVAVEAMTDANLNNLNTFYDMNPATFAPIRADQRSYLANTFSGALGGAGQASRDALEALYRRPALKGEELYCTGTGTTLAPGALDATATGQVTNDNILAALAL
jgi:hypothetical protein